MVAAALKKSEMIPVWMRVMKYRMGGVNCPTLLGSSSSEEEGDDPCVDGSHEVQDGLGKLPYTAW